MRLRQKNAVAVRRLFYQKKDTATHRHFCCKCMTKPKARPPEAGAYAFFPSRACCRGTRPKNKKRKFTENRSALHPDKSEHGVVDHVHIIRFHAFADERFSLVVLNLFHAEY